MINGCTPPSRSPPRPDRLLNHGMNTTSTSPAADQGYDLNGLFALLLRRKRLIALTTLVVALLGAWFTFTSAPKYEVKAKISYTDRYRAINPAGEWSGVEDESPAAAEIDILNSYPTLTEVVGEVHADGRRTGLGLRQQLHDVSNYWPWPRMKRKLFGGGGLKGEARVWADGPLPLGGVEIEFLNGGGVSIAQRSLFGESQKYDSFGPNQPLHFLNRNIYISGGEGSEGVQPGRVYIFHSNTLFDALKNVQDRLKVNETLKNSGVLEVRYADTNPDRAALVLNRLLEEYIKLDQQRLAEPATRSREFLEEEKKQLEATIASIGQQMSDAIAKHGGSTAMAEHAQEWIRHAVVLELELEQKEARVTSLHELLDDIDAEKLPVEAAMKQVSDWQINFGAPMDANRLQQGGDEIRIDLLNRLSALQEERAALAQGRSESAPELAELDARIDFLRGEMRNKLDADLRLAMSDAQTAHRMVKASKARLAEMPMLEGRLAGMQQHLAALNEQMLLLTGRLEKAVIAEKAAMATPTMEVIDPATPPLKAKFPRPLLIIAISIVMGFVAGIIFAILRDAFRKPLLSSAQLQAVTSVVSLGTLPLQKSKGENREWDEAVRSLRLNLNQLSDAGDGNCVAMVSAGAGEGCTTTVADLAVSLAGAGQEVLLIDADLRNPSQAQRFGVSVGNGFAENDAKAWNDAAQSTSQPNLWVLTSGKLNGHAGECAAQIPWREGLDGLKNQYDWVLIDAPPFLAVADAVPALQQADSVVLLNRYDYLNSRVVEMAVQRMKALDIPLAACVLNGYRTFGVRGYVDGFAFDRMAKRSAG